MPIEEENIKGLLSKWGLTAKPCDSCHFSAALLFCRAHSAFLCTTCDSKIHAAASTARHERVWMCEVCEQAPAAVTCKADAAALCSSCDRDIHSANPLARRHDRVPVVPFFQTPPDLSAAAKTASPPSGFFLSDEGVQPPHADVVYAASVDDESWLIPNLQGKLAGPDFLYSSDVDSMLDSGSPNFSIKHQVNNPMFNQRGYSVMAAADSVVPSQPKSSHLNNFSNENCFEIDFKQSKLSPFNFSAQCISQSISSSDVGIVPDGNSNSMSEVSNFQVSKPASINGGGELDGGSAAQPVKLSRLDRAARVMRYREKRKNRKFEKTIRYASRKAYAEARPRIKGRFVKRTNADIELDQIYTSSVAGTVGGFLVDDELYGVVPSF